MHFGLKYVISTAFTFVMFVRGEALISIWMSKGAFLLEGGAYMRSGAY